MATNTPEECSLCTEKYNEEEKAPRFLPCHHYCCTECIDSLILKQTKVCPYCRQSFQAISARNLSLNTGLLDVLKLMKEKEEQLFELQERGSASSSNQATLKELQKEAKKLTKEIIGNYHHAEDRINSAIRSLKELIDNWLQEIRLMQDDILTKGKKQLEQTLQKVKYIERQLKTLENQQEAIRSKKSQMEEAITKLDAANTFIHNGSLKDAVEEVNTEAKKFLGTFNHATSSNEESHPIIEKVTKNTKEKIGIIQEVLSSPVEGEEEILFLSEAQQSSIHDPVPAQIPTGSCQKINAPKRSLPKQGASPSMEPSRKHISTGRCREILVPARSLPEQGMSIPMESSPTPEDARKHISMNDLRERNAAVLRLIEQGKVYVEQEEGGRRRHARMTLDEEYRICVHHLSDERLHLPHDAHLLQYDDVMSVDNPSSARRAFLVLGTDEESLGRIVIKLKPKSKRAENFVSLCIGLLGPSYVRTRILDVGWKDGEGESVRCGDYEFNNGEGGMEVIPGAGEEWNGEWEGPWVEGSVGAWYRRSARASLFGIVNKDLPNCTLSAVFGTVDTGLNVVQDAVSHYSDITKVQTIDCGIILPL